MFGFTQVSRVPLQNNRGAETTYRAEKALIIPGYADAVFTHLTITQSDGNTSVRAKTHAGGGLLSHCLLYSPHRMSPVAALEATLRLYPQSAPKEWVECRLADTKKGERVRLTNEDGVVEFTVEGQEDKSAEYRSSRHATYYQYVWPKSEVLRTPPAPVVPTHPGIWMNKDGVPVKFHPSDFPSPRGRRSYLESRAPWVELVPKED